MDLPLKTIEQLIRYKQTYNLHWRDLATKIGLKPAYLTQLINGTRGAGPITIPKLAKFCEANSIYLPEEFFRYKEFFPIRIGDIPERFDLNAAIESLEREKIAWALGLSRGCKAVAAEILGLQRTTLVEKCRKYGYPIGKKNVASESSISVQEESAI